MKKIHNASHNTISDIKKEKSVFDKLKGRERLSNTDVLGQGDTQVFFLYCTQHCSYQTNRSPLLPVFSNLSS